MQMNLSTVNSKFGVLLLLKLAETRPTDDVSKIVLIGILNLKS